MKPNPGKVIAACVLHLSFIWLTGHQVLAQSTHSLRRDADAAYLKEQYSEAEESYRKADAKAQEPNTTYNLGNAIYRQGRFDEAIQKYENAAQSAGVDDQLKNKAFYNLGNAYFEKDQLEKSVEAYKNALRIDPQDEQAKKNLALAQKLLQVKMQQQQKNQTQEKKENQQQDQQQQPQNQEQNQPPSQQKQQPSDSEKNQQQLSKEEAEKLLEIMEQEEQKVQEKLRKAQAKPSKSSKDW